MLIDRTMNEHLHNKQTVDIIRQELENIHQTEQWLCLAWRAKVQGEKRLENKSGKEKLLNIDRVAEVK